MVDQECSDAYENHYKLMVEALDEVAPHNRELYFSVRGWLQSFFEAGYDAGKQKGSLVFADDLPRVPTTDKAGKNA